jgi:hypothetical protein
MFAAEYGEEPTDRRADEPPVWALEPDTDVTMGGEHAEGCVNGPDGTRDDDCDCETREFSWSSCDACGSHLGGTRHAYTCWTWAP